MCPLPIAGVQSGGGGDSIAAAGLGGGVWRAGGRWWAGAGLSEAAGAAPANMRVGEVQRVHGCVLRLAPPFGGLPTASAHGN